MTDTWESTPFIEEVWESQATGITWATVFRDGGAGGGAVDSVNGQTGTVVLASDDIGFTQTTPGDWTTDPDHVGEALDELAARESGTGGAVDSVNGETGTVVLDAADVGAIATSARGNSNGVASLDGDGTVPDIQLPSSIARDSEIGTQITAHDGSGTAHATQFAGKVSTSAIDTDSTLAADSDTRVPSQKAVKAHVAAVPKPFRVATPVGQWVGAPAVASNGVGSPNLILSAAGRGNMSLVFLPAGTYDRIAINVSSSAANTARLGLYACGSDGMPTGSAVLDAGTVSTASTGQQEISVSFVVPVDSWFWAACFMDAYTAVWSVVGHQGQTTSPAILGLPTRQDANTRTLLALTCTGQATGALPAASAFSGWVEVTPKITLRRSA